MKVVGKTKETLHGFNFPAQIGNIGDPRLGQMNSDTSKDATIDNFPVQEGDIVVVGTDGLWDNVFEDQIAKILAKSDIFVKSKNGVVVKDDIDKLVKEITLLALDQSESNTLTTPWSVSLEEEYKRRGRLVAKKETLGGKVDDITVILSYFQKKQ